MFYFENWTNGLCLSGLHSQLNLLRAAYRSLRLGAYSKVMLRLQAQIIFLIFPD